MFDALYWTNIYSGLLKRSTKAERQVKELQRELATVRRELQGEQAGRKHDARLLRAAKYAVAYGAGNSVLRDVLEIPTRRAPGPCVRGCGYSTVFNVCGKCQESVTHARAVEPPVHVCPYCMRTEDCTIRCRMCD